MHFLNFAQHNCVLGEQHASLCGAIYVEDVSTTAQVTALYFLHIPSLF